MPSINLRIARPTNDLEKLTHFYTTALGMRIIGSFKDHAGFDGVMLGLSDCTWHLEFTYQHRVTVDPAPTKEHLLVFYLPAKEDWDAAVNKIVETGGIRVQSENPYWDVKGATFEDPDGYRVVLQNAPWP